MLSLAELRLAQSGELIGLQVLDLLGLERVELVLIEQRELMPAQRAELLGRHRRDDVRQQSLDRLVVELRDVGRAVRRGAVRVHVGGGDVDRVSVLVRFPRAQTLLRIPLVRGGGVMLPVTDASPCAWRNSFGSFGMAG